LPAKQEGESSKHSKTKSHGQSGRYVEKKQSSDVGMSIVRNPRESMGRGNEANVWSTNRSKNSRLQILKSRSK
jgi:hypothetical protein